VGIHIDGTIKRRKAIVSTVEACHAETSALKAAKALCIDVTNNPRIPKASRAQLAPGKEAI
jgi:hypothetical protein